MEGVLVNGLEDAVMDLGALVLQLGRTPRATFHPDGKRSETVTDHTVMLGVIGCAVAAALRPDLDQGLIAQYSLIHDLVEGVAGVGDTSTLLLLGDAERLDKAAREQHGFRIIAERFGSVLPWLVQRIAEYEALSTPEARWVKAFDKAIPKITHVLNGCVTPRAAGATAAQMRERYDIQGRELAESYGREFPELLKLRDALVDRMLTLMTTAD